MEKINKICKAVLKITDEEIQIAKEQIEKQLTYMHPLKNARAGKINKIGSNNFEILQKFKEFRQTIKDCKP